MKPAIAESRIETMPAAPAATRHEPEEGHHFEWIEFARIALVGIAAAVAWSRAVPQFHGFDLIALGAGLIGGYPGFGESHSNPLAPRMTLERFMTHPPVSAPPPCGDFSALLILPLLLRAG